VWRKAEIRRNTDVCQVPILLQKSQKALRRISAKGRNNRQSRINAASNPLPESPVSLSHGGVVPHIIIQSLRLRLGEFESHAAKRLLQQNLPEADNRAMPARTGCRASRGHCRRQALRPARRRHRPQSPGPCCSLPASDRGRLGRGRRPCRRGRPEVSARCRGTWPRDRTRSCRSTAPS
jgi:hypothetical protein